MPEVTGAILYLITQFIAGPGLWSLDLCNGESASLQTL